MLSVHLICVGKLKEKFYLAACAEYQKRLGAYCKLELTELPEERLPQNPSRAQIDAALEREAAAIRGKIPPNSYLVALCVEGRPHSSQELARLVRTWQDSAARHLVFVIGGEPEKGGQGPPVHVPHDLSPPPGPGHGAGADLSGL